MTTVFFKDKRGTNKAKKTGHAQLKRQAKKKRNKKRKK
jgi:hypothetical protein